MPLSTTIPSMQAGPGATPVAQELADLRLQLQERDDLLALAAHELRNPLHGLSLQLRLVRKAAELADPGMIERHLGKAQQMLERYAERLTLLLDLTRLNEHAFPVDPQPVDLTRLLSVLIDMLTSEAQFHRVHVKLAAPHSLEVVTDARALEQIVGNLLLNAFKHAACSTVVVALRPAGCDEVEIDVVDDGCGIAPEDQARIFSKFARGHGGGTGGSGLGLWIVRKLLAVLGGSILLRSREGAGSAFTLRIPTNYRADTHS
jgi:signal transduction histidine kinase